MNMIAIFQGQRNCNLGHIANATTTSFWKQGRKSGEMLGMIDVEANQWKVYVEQLKKIHVRIRDEEVALVWATSPSLGQCTPSLGYKAMFVDANQEGDPWWWKIKAPMKTNVYMSLTLRNMALTWEVPRK
jgi:hypothetical protein